jgi:hypothetical protein
MPEIGDYIPNIVYIQRRTEEQATGGGGGGGGGRGQTKLEAELKETYTAWEKSDERIGMIIGTVNGGYYVKAGEIALAINKSGQTGEYESTALINADHVNISGGQTAYTLAGDLYHDASGKLVITSAAGLYVHRDEAGHTGTFGVWDQDNFQGGIIIQAINGDTQMTLKADKIDIDGVVTALGAKAIGCASLTVEGAATFKGANAYAEGAITAKDKIRSNTGFDPGNGNVFTEKNVTLKTYDLSNPLYFATTNGQDHTIRGDQYGYVVTQEHSQTIYYLGRSASNGGGS